MPAIIAFFAYLGKFLLPWMFFFMWSIGLSVITISGFDFVTDWLLDLGTAQLAAVTAYSAEVGQTVRVLNLDRAFSLVLSAITVRWAIVGVSGGIKTSFRLRMPPGAS